MCIVKPFDAVLAEISPSKPCSNWRHQAMLISTFKRFANRRCGIQLWQRSYHEHVIRNEDDYRQIWDYIEKNPARWVEDRYYIEGEHSSEGNSID